LTLAADINANGRAAVFSGEAKQKFGPSKVNSVRCLVADKKAGLFKLEVDWDQGNQG
jgi:hypothetical protein